MQLTTLGHAAAFVRLSSGSTLLVDPWLEDPAYFNSWWHFPPLRKKINDLGRIDAIYLSHDHPDHCDPKTLQKIPRETELLIPEFTSGSLDRIVNALGFHHIRRVPFREPFVWNGATIEFFRTDLPWDDSSIMITDGGVTLFNMNDCKLFDATLDDLGHKYKIDIALLPYSGAIQFPTCYELPPAQKLALCEKRRADHLKLFVDRARRLRTRHAIPFAAGYCLPSPEQWWMNDINNINAPALAKAALDAAPPAAWNGASTICIEMNPGDVWDSKSGLQRDAPAPDWSRHFEIVKDYAKSIAAEVASRREQEPIPAAGLADRFLVSFRKLVLEQRNLAAQANYRVVFDVRGAHGFVAHVDTTKNPAAVGLDEIDGWNLKIRIPSSMLDAVLDGRVTWDEILISFRMWFEERPPVYHEPWWALLHSSNRLDPKRYVADSAIGSVSV
ncbi:MAG: MBL fold metallo-hydrolase [Planctomycetota bacterium]